MMKRQSAAKKSDIRFVHYTRADAGIAILRSHEFWMRKSLCMNDYTEGHHGLERLRRAYPLIKTALESLRSGLFGQTVSCFDSQVLGILSDTYMTCVSEHDAKENDHGRLSMWRAYGGTTGVAFVLKSRPFIEPSNALNAYTSPVEYWSDKEFEQGLREVFSGFEANVDYLRTKSDIELRTYLFHAFRFAILSTKHSGFHEEREWRVIYGPTVEPSSKLKHEIVIIGGVPQPIYKIPLKDVPDEGFVGATIPDLVERVIIGPTQFPMALYEAFVGVMKEAGVVDAEKRVIVSNIPLRT